jgi:hypothetical protein
MLEWLEYLGNIVVVGFLLLLMLIAWVVYPLWSTYRGFRDMRPVRSWTFSLRSLTAIVVASAFLSWFLGWHADDLALLNWKRPYNWLLIAPPTLVLLAYVGLIWHLVRSAMERGDRSATDRLLRRDSLEVCEPAAAPPPARADDCAKPQRKKRRWWRRRLFGGYPALRSGRMPESPPQDDD